MPIPIPMIDTLLLTGAAGTLGRMLAAPLRGSCRRLLLSDLPGPLAALATDAGHVDGAATAAPTATATATAGVEHIACDLADGPAVGRLLHGVDAVVHLGGVAVEGPFEPILQANIRGSFHLYDAARRAGTRRIVFASSNHVTGCHPQGQRIGPADPPRPDGHYGLSKLFGEGLARLHWDRYGIETVCLRIGTATPLPPDRRGLATWVSPGDLARLVVAALTAPQVGFLVAYGVSDNARGWWDSADAWQRLGFVPHDAAEAHAPAVQHIAPAQGSAAARLQGGVFLDIGPFDGAAAGNAGLPL